MALAHNRIPKERLGVCHTEKETFQRLGRDPCSPQPPPRTCAGTHSSGATFGKRPSPSIQSCISALSLPARSCCRAGQLKSKITLYQKLKNWAVCELIGRHTTNMLPAWIWKIKTEGSGSIVQLLMRLSAIGVP